jgi:hypothetical protein
MGPFGMMDLFGLDLMRESWSTPTKDAHREALRERVEPFLTEMVEADRLGQKSGAGFYTYPEPAYQQPDFADAEPPSETASNALLGALVTAAVMIEVKGVADRSDIDAAWRAATGRSASSQALVRIRSSPCSTSFGRSISSLPRRPTPFVCTSGPPAEALLPPAQTQRFRPARARRHALVVTVRSIPDRAGEPPKCWRSGCRPDGA